MSGDTPFLRTFYRGMILWGFVGLSAGLLFYGILGLKSFFFGWFSIAVIIGLWDLSLRFTLRARKTSRTWETLLVLVRYALLGGLFYAIMRWFVVSWPWFFAGTTTILPAMLTATFFHRNDVPETVVNEQEE